MVCFVFQELSQEKQRTLELLGVKEQDEEVEEAAVAAEESSARSKSEDSEDPGDVDLLQDLRHIEEQMKVLLKEKEQADEKWVRIQTRMHKTLILKSVFSGDFKSKYWYFPPKMTLIFQGTILEYQH